MKVYPKDYFELKPQIIAGTCFVIMPFASNFDEIFYTIKDAVESNQMQCLRGDEVLNPHILVTILENISNAEYIIVDLTGQNPNVFYELGLAHCVKDIDNLILISQKIEDVPFDLKHYRCILYEQSNKGTNKLKTDLVNTLKKNIGLQYTFTVDEKEKFLLPELLSANRYLYKFGIWLPFVANDSVKSQIYLTKCKSDGTEERLIDQDLFMQIGREEKIENIPWKIRLLSSANKKATISIRAAANRR